MTKVPTLKPRPLTLGRGVKAQTGVAVGIGLATPLGITEVDRLQDQVAKPKTTNKVMIKIGFIDPPHPRFSYYRCYQPHTDFYCIYQTTGKLLWGTTSHSFTVVSVLHMTIGYMGLDTMTMI